jgi:rhodanese-related sulfurtransferase
MPDTQLNADPSAEVRITAERAAVLVDTADGAVEIRRIQDPNHRIEGEWARTSRPAPPAVIQPLVPVAGVVPLGELELIDMLERPDAIVIDSRKSEQYPHGTIPGAVNIPFTEMLDRLDELGCKRTTSGWDCSEAKPVALFCNGVWCGQSPTAIRRMVEAGYPPERIFYYRNGMQGWHLLGLTVQKPKGGQKD